MTRQAVRDVQTLRDRTWRGQRSSYLTQAPYATPRTQRRSASSCDTPIRRLACSGIVVDNAMPYTVPMQLTALLTRAQSERRKSRRAQTRAYLEVARSRRISLHAQWRLRRVVRLRTRREAAANAE